MRALLVSSRYPWPPYTGDRLRAVIWIEALRRHAEVTLVSPPPKSGALAEGFTFVPAASAPAAIIPAALRTIRERLPFHALMTAGYDWRGALSEAGRSGEFDAAVVLLSRCEPWVWRMVKAKRMILDGIDSLAASTEQRSLAARGPAALFWRVESRRTARLEAAASRRFDTVTLVNGDESRFFDDRVAVVSNGVEIGAEPPLTGRRFDFGFWGRLAYFANRRAVSVLLEEVWPKIRAQRPDATLLVAGADAPAEILRANGRDGVTVVSPMNDREATLREIRIALFPFAFGTGQSNKVLEAAEAGCAIVATPQAMRGLELLAPAAIVDEDPARLVDAAVRLCGDAAAAASHGEEGRRLVAQHFSRERTYEELARVAFGGIA